MTLAPETTRSLARQLRKGFGRRCGRCGQGKAFRTYFEMEPRCDVCDYWFEREEGYWTGAMIVNIAVCEAWFFLLFIGTVLLTLPDVAWAPLLIVGLVTNGLLPVVFYPFSKSIWMALDLYTHPLETGEGGSLAGQWRS